MGTNYYRKRIPTQKEKEELGILLDNCIDGTVSDREFKEKFEQLINEVHICKISCGWQVCFDHNWGKYYQPNRKDLARFLSEPGTVIEDEYGERFTPEEFWDKVDKHNIQTKNKWTAESYRLWEESRGNFYPCHCCEDIKRCESMFNVQCNNETDFFVDGLRFAVYTDFC